MDRQIAPHKSQLPGLTPPGSPFRTVEFRGGFTIIELLVSIAVISVLMALLIPAVQSVRESARRTQCQNNVRQMALGMQNFHSVYGMFPGNGWGYAWVAEPGRAAGTVQPGGWIYQLLPQLELANVWQTGSGTTGQARRDALRELCRVRLPLFKCPSRPCSQMGMPSTVFDYRNASPPDRVARTDYAINEGDVITNTPGGPADLAEGDDPAYAWTDVSKATGISWQRGAARIQDVTDGSSNTYLCGEKYVSLTGYEESKDPGYDQTMLSGVDLDLARWTTEPPISDRTALAERRFGSAHVAGCFMGMCDGSVRAVSYQIDADVHRWLGDRSDGKADSN